MIKHYLAFPYNEYNIMLTYTYEEDVPKDHIKISKELYEELLEVHQATHYEIRQSGSEPYFKCYDFYNFDPNYYWDIESESFKLKEEVDNGSEYQGAITGDTPPNS